MKEENKLVIFQGKQIRKIFHNEEWWFSVIDLINALEISTDARNYWKVLKSRLIQEGSEQTVTNCNQLKLMAVDGKYRKTDCANTEIALRIIQSIPSAKAEPFKLWLAQVGYERVKEIEDPELASQRAKQIYKANLTAEISKATFGMTPSEYKNHKNLKRENLRDHMSDLELIFSMLGEAATTELTRKNDAQGFKENKNVARVGGEIAGKARLDLESKISQSIISKENYLPKSEEKKLSKTRKGKRKSV
jgi:prophage antirepressor-like protein